MLPPACDMIRGHWLNELLPRRYNPNKGELTLVSERHPEREENRLHIMDTLHALIEEGERVHPSEKAAEHSEDEQAVQAGAE